MIKKKKNRYKKLANNHANLTPPTPAPSSLKHLSGIFFTSYNWMVLCNNGNIAQIKLVRNKA